MLESLESELMKLGASKVKKLNQRECTILVAELRNSVYLIAAYKYGLTDNYVCKILPSTKVLNWNCIELEYNPHGLYVLASSEEELINKAIKKLQLIMKADWI
ncbi:MAG: hypothetical protein RMH77_06090 [Sulfolobales archaeon]|nr:hypothetical protein [Sulfolobales archaeon]MDW7969954.1 hypothetical protein [Sulfolobales archaeon]